MNQGTVSELWRYPVKSTGGEPLDLAELGTRGIRGDRDWAVRTPDGKLGSGKNSRRFRRVDGLLGLRSRLVGAEPVLTLPDGTELRGCGADTDATIAGALGLPGAAVVPEGEVPHFDAGGVHLITTSAMAWFQGLLPDAQLGARRFRPNVVVDTPAAGRPEEAWIGRDLTIGAVRLRVTRPTERCVMVTAEQPGLRHDARILKAIADANDLRFGVYAEVVTPGTVRIGDAVIVA